MKKAFIKEVKDYGDEIFADVIFDCPCCGKEITTQILKCDYKKNERFICACYSKNHSLIASEGFFKDFFKTIKKKQKFYLEKRTPLKILINRLSNE